jgi:hypothetical protein
VRDSDLEEHAKSSISTYQPTESTQNFLTSEIGSHVSKAPVCFFLDFSAYPASLPKVMFLLVIKFLPILGICFPHCFS